jgi:hypothetical protein
VWAVIYLRIIYVGNEHVRPKNKRERNHLEDLGVENIEINLQEIGGPRLDSSGLRQGQVAGFCVKRVMRFKYHKIRAIS